MVGIVIVAHSYKLAEGVKELAEQMSQGRVSIVAAGGLDKDTIGTNAERILKAISEAYQEDGVLIMVDLGSAILSTEMAIEMLPEEQRKGVKISNAPLVEGAMAAVVEASLGSSLEKVNASALAVVNLPKVAGEEVTPVKDEKIYIPEVNEIVLTLKNKFGLHARPAALFVQTAGSFTSQVLIKNITRNTNSVNAKSLLEVLTLGTEQGQQIVISAEGKDAKKALSALQELVESGLGEEIEEVSIKPESLPAKPPVKIQLPTASEPVYEKPEAQLILKGVGVSQGIAIGLAFVYNPKILTIPDYKVENIDKQFNRLANALNKAKQEIKELRDIISREAGSKEAGSKEAEIFNAHLLFLEDNEFLGKIKTKITEDKINVESALMKIVREYTGKMRLMDSDLFRQRAVDIEEVGRRVLRILLGVGTQTMTTLPEKVIVLAEDLAPSDTIQMDREKVLGFCTARGSATSHTAILASSLGIPAVVGIGEKIKEVPENSILIIDSQEGLILVNPEKETLKLYQDKQNDLHELKKRAVEKALGSAITLDGRHVEVSANIGDLDTAKKALEFAADGIGLLRTEFLYLNREIPPGEEEQVQVYKEILETMGPRPVIFRTLDIGGDKPASYLSIPKELNPFLGWRAIRYCLDNPEILKTQLRAILRSGYGYNIKIMFPMITTLEELLKAKKILEEVRNDLQERGIKQAETFELGIMIEVPAAALMADVLAQEVDFFSIGTNDLIQYTMACDRTNEQVASLYQPLHPAVLHLIRIIIDSAHQAGKWVGMCGEMASLREAVPILLGLGLDEFSLSPQGIPEIKKIIGDMTVSQASEIANKALSLNSVEEIKKLTATVLKSLK